MILDRPLQSGSLRKAITERTRRALTCGALQPIRTKQTHLQDGQVRFLVRMVSSLARKDLTRSEALSPMANNLQAFNPFLPYDRKLFVADLSATHVGLLNKYPVMEEHLLIVTRHFEHQETVLSRSDFEALWPCVVELDGLGFYNAGAEAGASQPHKHLQVVPLPLAEGEPTLPIDPLLKEASSRNGIGHVPGFPFQHAFARLPEAASPSGSPEPGRSHQCYQALLAACGLEAGPKGRQAGAYNLLATKEWMLVVPRSREFFQEISINALGFAGSLFVRTNEELDRLRSHHPLSVLAAVGMDP